MKENFWKRSAIKAHLNMLFTVPPLTYLMHSTPGTHAITYDLCKIDGAVHIYDVVTLAAPK